MGSLVLRKSKWDDDHDDQPAHLLVCIPIYIKTDTDAQKAIFSYGKDVHGQSVSLDIDI